MNGASKILTVSYGTFSCTLEGFDDPFSTMKAIAEYFRDLAAEDRYFGAEPPTPDAAMLHRIAEREIQRRVEAKIQENGVVLRASDSVAAEAAPAVVPSVTPAPVVPAPVAPANLAPAPVAPTVVAVTPVDVAAPVPSVAAATAPMAESVVEKLSRLRSEVAAQPGATGTVATVPTVSFALPDYLEDEHAEGIETAPATPAAAAFAAAPEATTAPAPEPAPEPGPAPAPEPAPEPAAAAEDFLPESDAPTEIAPAALAEDAPLPEEVGPMADEAVLAALTAVLPAPVAPIAAVATEDQAVGSATPDLPDSLMAALADSLAGTDDAEAAPDQPDGDDRPAAEAGDTGSDAQADEVFAELNELVAGLTAAPADAAAAQQPAVEAAFDRSPEDTLDAAFDRTEDEVVALADEQPDDDATATGTELRPGAAEKLQRARARVIRIRKVDDAAPEATVAETGPVVSAAPARTVQVQRDAVPPAAKEPAPDEDFAPDLSDIFAEVAEDTPAAPKAIPPAAAPAAPAPIAAMPEAEPAEGLLSAEDEAELMRELAALRQNDEEGPEAEAAAGASAFVLQQENRKGFDGPTADEALGRLMKQTDTEMEGPETKRRQSAIAHLKAAVAATVAERKVTGEKPAEATGVSRLARYRNDLAMVVKSALPGRGTAEPQKDRPAPLVLVSEQRIDKPRAPSTAAPAAQAPTVVAAAPAPIAPAPIAPVRPRRVSSSGLAMQAAEDPLFDDEDAEGDLSNLFGDAKGFSDFVNRVGATTLEEILEASAAYLAGVERLESFSRPQVMSQVGAVIPAGSFQREDGLRGFGTLLRNGRISKLRRGQFVLSEESPYLAEARKIVG